MERNLTHIAMFAALIAVLGLIPKMDLAVGVPITAQTLGIMLCGTVLGARRGALAVGLFVLLVALGLPLLSGGRGGIGVFAMPSAGFLIGFPVAAYVTGWVMERTTLRVDIAAGAASVIGGIAVLYIFGIIGLMAIAGLGLQGALLAAMAYLPGDLLKTVLAAMVTAGLAKARPASLLSRA